MFEPIDFVSGNQTSGLAKSFNGASDFLISNERYSDANRMNTFKSQAPTFIDQVTKVDFNYDYSKVPMNLDNQGFWEDLATPVKDASAFVWNTAEGTWDTVKTGVLQAADSVTNAVDSAGTKLIDTASGVLTSLRDNLILLFFVLIIGLYLLARSGLLKQAAGFMR